MTDLVVRPDPLADDELFDPALADQELSDEELTALALAADPDAPLPDDAVPFEGPSGRGIGLLPSWYMSPVVRSGHKRRYRIAVGAVVVAFVTIDLFGLCATYGPLVLA
jgi:hypothetical protein